MELWIVWIIVALLAGSWVGFLLGKLFMQTKLAASETALAKQQEFAARQEQNCREQLAVQKKFFEDQLLSQKSLQKEAAQAQYEQLKAEFKVLAEKVLAEKSESFEKNNKLQLDAILTPFKVKLDEFKSNAETTRRQTLETNARLSEQISLLMKSSREIGEEANQLARALRSDNKMQGNWGEMILDEILSSSGLIKDVHYQTQVTLRDDSGEKMRNDDSGKAMCPDVVVYYPDGKAVIIDSKASLVSYMQWVNTDDEKIRAAALEQHLKSVKNHVDILDKKNYSAYLKTANREAVDFVVMFMPNAGAYELAMRHDVNLWQYAFNKKVLIVSPVNLMALLQLIHIGWKRCEQDRNQEAIINNASMLLERLYNFYKEFDKVGELLEKAQTGFTDAADILRGTNGRHGVVPKGEELKKLGVKLKKKLALPKRLQPDEFVSDISEGVEVEAEVEEFSTADAR